MIGVASSTADAPRQAEEASATAASAKTDAERKALATVQALAALQGIELVALADASLLAHRAGWFRPLADLAEARAWLNRLQGKAA